MPFHQDIKLVPTRKKKLKGDAPKHVTDKNITPSADMHEIQYKISKSEQPFNKKKKYEYNYKKDIFDKKGNKSTRKK